VNFPEEVLLGHLNDILCQHDILQLNCSTQGCNMEAIASYHIVVGGRGVHILFDKLYSCRNHFIQDISLEMDEDDDRNCYTLLPCSMCNRKESLLLSICIKCQFVFYHHWSTGHRFYCSKCTCVSKK
jgi:hypothetical protein